MLSFLLFAVSLSSCVATPNLHIVNGETQMTLSQSAPISRGVDISPDGNYLLTGGLNVFTHWDISKGILIKRYHAALPQIMGTYLTTAIIPVAFFSNGKYALSGGEDVKVWGLSSGTVIRTITDGPAASIGVSSDGRRVLMCDESEWAFREDKLIVYDAVNGTKIAEWEAGGSGGIIALSPDGEYALSSGGGGRKSIKEDRGVIHLWDVSSGAELKTIQGHSGSVGTKAVAFSPDGRSILSVGGSDGLAKLWDTASGSLIRAFKVSDDRFVGIRRFGGIVNGWVAFTPDGKRIIYMGSDASFRIFDARTGDEIATLVLFDDGKWLVVTPEGYYNASEKGAHYLKVRYEEKDYGVDQFYDVFYRPDIVAAKLGGQDISGLVSVTMKDASKSPPPSVEFATAPVDADRSTEGPGRPGAGLGWFRVSLEFLSCCNLPCPRQSQPRHLLAQR